MVRIIGLITSIVEHSDIATLVGEWKMADRFVPRKDVVTIQFMNDGNSLLCASSDGSVYALILSLRV